jgi:S-formylglutathione hydrolase FrmB
MFNRVISSFFLFLLLSTVAEAQNFSVSFTSAASTLPFTGKVFLFLSKDNKKPKDGEVGLDHSAYCSMSVENIKPGEAILFTDAAQYYPVALSGLERGEYYVQAVWDKNEGGRAISRSPGNMYNNSVKCTLSKDFKQIFTITCSESAPKKTFSETKYAKEVIVPSTLLTSFFKKPVSLNGAVILPKSYEEQPQRRYPVLYRVSGFGGDYHSFSGKTDFSQPLDTTECIRVILDGNCPLGHSVYANSDNNGPVGDALTQEFIPFIEKSYRCNGARFLGGHSSGGWTVLWLQTQYPKVFTACWSSSPDPVDFRSFQKVDLYNDKNMFYTSDSSLRNVATIAGFISWATMKSIYGAEHIIYRGEQMHSFNAVFSQRNADGSPASLCNDLTGEIDPATVAHWKNYDISLLVRNNWDQIKNDLQGKVRISVGNQDNFLLNYAVHLFDGEMKKLNSGFVFQYYPGDHFTVSSPEYMSAGEKFLEGKYNEWLASHPAKK